jgi:hypothetical protein
VGKQILEWVNRKIILLGYDCSKAKVFGQINKKDCIYITYFRPITPDDGAIICRLPKYKNIYCNNGHGSKDTSHCLGAA